MSATEPIKPPSGYPAITDITDAPQEISALALVFLTLAVAFLPRLGAAILILLCGYFLATHATARGVSGAIRRTRRVERMLHPVIHAAVLQSILGLVGIVAPAQANGIAFCRRRDDGRKRL